jgi:hypothetical protein
MQCKQCGGPMMSETVIKLRRSLIGFRETRFQGAYCTWCKIGVVINDDSSVTGQPIPITIGMGRCIRRLLPAWRRTGASRYACGHNC